jgi:hypothetical protein
MLTGQNQYIKHNTKKGQVPLHRTRQQGGTKSHTVESIASPSLPNYGGTRLDPIRGHASAPTGPREPGVHDGGEACNLSCVRGPCIQHASRGIRSNFCGVPWVRVQCAITLISPFIVAVLWPGAARSDPFGDLTYRDHCDYARPTWGLTPTFICETISYASGSHRAQVRKQQFWVVWTSMSNPVTQSIPTFTSPWPNLQMGGRKHASF